VGHGHNEVVTASSDVVVATMALRMAVVVVVATSAA